MHGYPVENCDECANDGKIRRSGCAMKSELVHNIDFSFPWEMQR
jgi:hypothetical protein